MVVFSLASLKLRGILPHLCSNFICQSALLLQENPRIIDILEFFTFAGL
jgi:hypothetical protein